MKTEKALAYLQALLGNKYVYKIGKKGQVVVDLKNY